MATALTADAMLAALAKWGITPRFYKSDWRTHNRNAVQGWGPINGFVVHNFGSDTSDPNSLAYLYNGDDARGMPGPLSQFAITDDGAVWVIGWGTANHTGSIDPRLHALVLNDAAPLDADFRPATTFSNNTGTHSINDNYVGVEMTYGKAPTAAQRKSVALLGAALMDALGAGYTGGSVIGHRETDTGRSDPVGIPMWQLRRDINALLKTGPGRTASSAGPLTPAPIPKPAPAPTPEVPDMQPTDIVPGTDPAITWRDVAVMAIRGDSAYKRVVEGGWIDKRLDVVEASIGSLRSAIEADDKAQAQAILDRIEVSLAVKPASPAA